MNKTFSANTLANHKYLMVGAILTVAVAAAIYKANLLAVALSLFFILIFLAKRPELPLAIMFNGTFIYFYLVYRLGFQTSRNLTGAFYSLLVYSFLLAEILLLMKRHVRFRISVIDVLFSALFLLIFLSYLIFSTDNDSAYKKIAFAPMLAIAPYFGARLLLSETRIKRFLVYSVFVAAVLMIPAFYELLNNPNLVRRIRFSMYMFEDTTIRDNPVLFGNMYAIVIIIVTVWLLEKRKFKLRHLVPVGLSMYMVLLSGSRGIIFSLATSMTFYLFAISRIKLRTKLFIVSALLLLFLGSYKLLPKKLTKFYQYSVSVEARQDSISSIQMRITKWKQAIRDITENPTLGVGTGNSDDGSGRPHNIVLEATAELGIPGLFIFILLCYATMRKAMKFLSNKDSSNSHTLMKLILVLFIQSLTHAMFSGIITDQIRLYTTMGLIVCLDNLRLEKTKNEIITA